MVNIQQQTTPPVTQNDIFWSRTRRGFESPIAKVTAPRTTGSIHMDIKIRARFNVGWDGGAINKVNPMAPAINKTAPTQYSQHFFETLTVATTMTMRVSITSQTIAWVRSNMLLSPNGSMFAANSSSYIQSVGSTKLHLIALKYMQYLSTFFSANSFS